MIPLIYKQEDVINNAGMHGENEALGLKGRGLCDDCCPEALCVPGINF